MELPFTTILSLILVAVRAGQFEPGSSQQQPTDGSPFEELFSTDPSSVLFDKDFLLGQEIFNGLQLELNNESACDTIHFSDAMFSFDDAEFDQLWSASNQLQSNVDSLTRSPINELYLPPFDDGNLVVNHAFSHPLPTIYDNNIAPGSVGHVQSHSDAKRFVESFSGRTGPTPPLSTTIHGLSQDRSNSVTKIDAMSTPGTRTVLKANDDSELDLNLINVEENYEELCKLLGKERKASELEYFQRLTTDRLPRGGSKSPDPITLDLHGQSIYLPEWSRMQSATSSLVKLVLVVRFYQKLAPIWKSVAAVCRAGGLRDQYRRASQIMRCLTKCCDKDLVKFQTLRLNPFVHDSFPCQCDGKLLTINMETDVESRAKRHCISDNFHEQNNFCSSLAFERAGSFAVGSNFIDFAAVGVTTNQGKLPQSSFRKVASQARSALNLKKIEDDYRELCQLIGKEMDASELTYLQGLSPNRLPGSGKKVDPITLDIDGHRIDLPEWPQLQSATSTLAKLVLVARFYQKLAPIWQALAAIHKTSALRNQYWRTSAIMRCLTRCCGKSVMQFQKGRDNPFVHNPFSCQCETKLLTNNSELFSGDLSDSDVKALNMKENGENYRELCRLLEKEEDANELSYIKNAVPERRLILAEDSDRIILHVNNIDIHLSEYSQAKHACNTLVKLVLIARLHRKLEAIWPQINRLQKKEAVVLQYTTVHAIMRCVKFCCKKNLITFHKRWGNPFRHSSFSWKCCSGRVGPGIRCGFYDKNRKRSCDSNASFEE